ncbi:MAG: N-acetylmuramoyl-L-alanine amidase [Gammaproteobacteria bacterium]|nr:N-acetylmuramoyl-L-alanine amidase [Gammaproteobacteria bacterium]NNJ84007.1 AMIN domain-containing protein [Gammaproteobacteria bacterium]
MGVFLRTLGIALIFFLADRAAMASAEIKNLRMWPAPDHTRVVFDISAPVKHTMFSLVRPDRVVIDMPNVHMGIAPPKPQALDPLLKRIRYAAHKRGNLRVVLDLKRPVHPKSFLLRPNREYGHRLVIDLLRESDAPKAELPSSKSPARKPPAKIPIKLRKVIIAVDPGHGGEDTGAIGRLGAREKDVVLAIGKKLKTLLNQQRGIDAFLVRRGDYYVGLQKRTRIARTRQADLFISIHADAFRDPLVYGSSVYVLSENGASSEAAKWLADRENSSDLVGGVRLNDKDNLLASVLLDLSQKATLNDSVKLGNSVLNQLKKLGKTHKPQVHRAGFMVLKSPDVPSILVETAFISNPDEERRLRSSQHQWRVAKAILRGILGYFKNNAPPNTLLAARR